MNHHRAPQLQSRLPPHPACSSSSSSSSSPSPYQIPTIPLAASSAQAAPGSFHLDQYCVSGLNLHAAQARQRAWKLRNCSPLSPQESSTLSFSDSTSSSSHQRAMAEPQRPFRQSADLQSPQMGRAPALSFLSSGDPSQKTSLLLGMSNRDALFLNQTNISRDPLFFNQKQVRDPLFPEVPVLCGPPAFQVPMQSKATHMLDGDERPAEDCKRLKRTLEDLAKELLGDDHLDVANSSFSNMSSTVASNSFSDMASRELQVTVAEQALERDWTDAIEDFLCTESSSPPTTADRSTITSITPNTPISPTSNVQGHPRELLLACANAINVEDYTSARNALSSIEQFVSIYGDPMQRLAAYMAEGLAARMETIKEGHSNRLGKILTEASPTEILRGRQVLYHWCPYFKFGYMAANATIAEALRNESMIHIIDFDIGQGNQWHTLIGAFSQRPGGPPHVRITGVVDPTSPTSLEGVAKRLEEAARDAGVPFSFKPLKMDSSLVDPSMLECKAGEALAVNFAFHLHKMADESVSMYNPRDTLLRKVKAIQPKILTLVEHDANTNTAPFYPRFLETLNYFNAIFEALDAVLPRDSRERVNAEKHCLGRDIASITACEGAARSQRYEVVGKWRARMTMAGFRNVPPSPYNIKTIKELLVPYAQKYKLRVEAGALHLDWNDRCLAAASAWQ